MKKSLSHRIVTEHGQISNILLALPFFNQAILANVYSRTYEITVPWNSGCVRIPKKAASVFPKIDEISNDHICKSTKAIIEGE